MATEVYQLKVNNEKVKLGKGINADDEFASISDVHYKTISGFAYLDVVLLTSQEPITIVFPVTSAFNENNWGNIISVITQNKLPWPILGGWSQSLKLPLTGLLKDAIVDGTGAKHSFSNQKISFIWLKNYF